MVDQVVVVGLAVALVFADAPFGVQVKGLQNARGLQNASLNKGASTFHGNAKILII